MEEQVIQFNTAKILKLKGFDFDNETTTSLVHVYNQDGDYISSIEDEPIYGISQSLLQKWFREKHNILVYVIPNRSVSDVFHYKLETRMIPSDSISQHYNSWEEALEQGFLEALKLI